MGVNGLWHRESVVAEVTADDWIRQPVLFDVAAMLYTSGAMNGVSEAFGLREIAHQVSALVVTADPSVQDPSGIGDLIDAGRNADPTTPVSTRLDPTLLSHLDGSALLDRIGLLPRSQVAQFAAKNPSSIERMIVSPPKAAAVTSWWADLPAATRVSLGKTVPELVGNLDGLPFQARDAANRLALKQAIAKERSSVDSGLGRAQLVKGRHHLDVLEQVQRTLATKPGEPRRQLLTFDPKGETRAAVVVGDLATADYVSYLVPGMFFTVDGQMYDWTVIAQDLYTEQASWLKLLAASDDSMAGKTTATVAWIGYDTPGVLSIASLDRADEGAKFLGNAVRGVQAVRAGSEPYVTLISHSYGSTAAMIELAKGDVTVNALAMIGSPGSAAQSASQLDVKGDNVYVGEAAWDPVVNTAFYGSDPGTAAFGAHKMSVAGGTDAVTHKKLTPAIGHLGYFDPGSEAMRNLALIGIGQDSLVTDGTLADAGRTIAGAK
ncbi:alpha/beta hydrolase [Lacisediminihabitans sp.]|uniref:alpha/beta hydrolase n=1 Tax=Lacisediminihabitans sp. TaxID=2787631 RepID=UPI002EDAAFF6